MKKIVFLLPYPPPYAGPEIIAKEILQSDTIKNRDDIIFINSNIRKINSDKGKLNLSGILIFIRIYIIYIFHLLNTEKVFMYLSSSKIGFLRDSIYIITSSILNVKVYGHYHGANFNNFYNHQNKIYKKWIELSLSNLETLLVLGDFIKRKLKKIYDGDIKILHNGLNCNKFPRKNNYNSDPFTIFFMGHLTYPKGFYDLVDAYKILHKKYGTDIQFIFAGENIGFKKGTAGLLTGENKEYFLRNGKDKDEEIQDFLNNVEQYNSKYLGFVTGTEKLNAFHISNVFVFPSYKEGFGMACLEAMACGLPLIMTPVGIAKMPTVFKPGINGIITEKGAPYKISSDIEYFINNREKAERIGKYNAMYVRNNFDIEEVVNRLIKILENNI